MTDKTGDSLIGMLRQRTEEEELKQYLKASVGGYTKSSVMEYLSELRKRQQTSSETFNENMQDLLEEKESLKAENEKLLMQIAQAKADFMRLAEAKKQQELSKAAAHDHAETQKQPEQSKVAPVNANILYLKNAVPLENSAETDLEAIISELENELECQKTEFSEKEAELENQIEALKNEISEKEAELKKSNQEIKAGRDLLAYQKLELKKQEDKLAAFSDQIAELTASVKERDSIISQMNAEAAEKDNKVQSLMDENIKMMQSMELMSNSLDNMAIQNEKLVTANNALAQAFEDENKKVVRLINEKSEETVEKLILARRLEEIMNNLSSRELGKSCKSETPKETKSKTFIA